jgi:hypothetical protein
MAVQFKVKLGEKVFDVEATPGSEVIGSLKDKIAGTVGVSAEDQKWIFQGRILTSTMNVAESNIKEGSCVIIMKVAQKAAVAPNSPSPSLQQQQQAVRPTPAPAQMTGSQYQQPQAPTVPPATSAFVPRLAPNGAMFDRAMLLLLGNDEAAVANAVTTLLKIVSNIIQSPQEEKFRKVNRNNAAFIKKVGSVAGGNECMYALGFNLVGDDWVLEPHADSWDNIVICKSKAERFMQRLQAGNTASASSASPSISVPPLNAALVGSSANAQVSPTAADVLAFQQLLQMMAAGQGALPAQSSSQSSSSTSASTAASQAPDTSNSDSTADGSDTVG